MVRLNINLDESLKAYADEQIAKGRARNVDDLVASLLTDARNREKQVGDDEGIPVSSELEASLLEADQDPGTPMTQQDWEHIRSTLKGPTRGAR